MNPSRRLGILGGMFDPIHHGHLDTGAAAQRALDLRELLIVPSNIPPHRPQPIASSHHRFAMVAMAIAGQPGWRALDVELGQATRSFTSDTLRHFHAIGFLPTELFFITGADAFLEIATWKDYPALLDLAHFTVVARRGVKVSDLAAQLPTLASRMRRADAAVTFAEPAAASAASDHRLDQPASLNAPGAVAFAQPAGREPTWIFLIDAATADVSSTAIRQARLEHRSIGGMVPPSVQQHIEQHALYGVPPPNDGSGDDVASAQAGRLHGQD